MTLKKLCSEVWNLIIPSHFTYGFLVVWKNGRSWNWYPIFSEDWEPLENSGDERYEEGFDFKITDKEVMQAMENAVRTDSEAVIIMSDELKPDIWTCKSLMEDIVSIYGDLTHSLANFYEICCM